MTTTQQRSNGESAESSPPAGDDQRVVSVDDIDPNPEQPRKRFDSADEAALAESIARYGVLQPLLVTSSYERSGRFLLIAGERRWRAARRAGLREVPVRVIAAVPRRRVELALVENVQRNDLGPLERAHAYQVLMDAFGMTQAQVAEAVGISRPAVANTLRLQKLDDEMQQALVEGRITESHGRTLVGISDLTMRRRMFNWMLTGRLNLRQAERAARRMLAKPQSPDVELDHVAERLQWRLGTRVRFVGSRNRGRIQIEYRDPEDLDALLGVLLPE